MLVMLFLEGWCGDHQCFSVSVAVLSAGCEVGGYFPSAVCMVLSLRMTHLVLVRGSCGFYPSKPLLITSMPPDVISKKFTETLYRLYWLCKFSFYFYLNNSGFLMSPVIEIAIYKYFIPYCFNSAYTAIQMFQNPFFPLSDLRFPKTTLKSESILGKINTERINSAPI